MPGGESTLPPPAGPAYAVGLSLSSETVKPALADFATYARSLKGDEKGEAQLFLDRFFRALGHADGLQGAGASLEFRIAKKPGSAQLELLTGDAAAKDNPKRHAAAKSSPTSFGPTACSSR